MKQRHLTPEILVTRLGDYLVEKGLVTPQEVNQALEIQAVSRRQGAPPQLLGKILVQMGAINQEDLDEAVTEQIIQLKNALQDANSMLEQRVRERTAELELALKKLAELNQLKSNFVSNISHELRTPLTHIMGYLHLLSSGQMGLLSPDQAQALSVMERSSDRLEKLIDDLLQFSIMEPDQVKLDLQFFDLGVLSHEIIAHFSEKMASRGLHFSQVIPATPFTVHADAEKISWLIGQLLDNALKFTPQGGEVELTLQKVAPFVRVSVRDTGIGIPPERIPEIFEPFHQLDGSSTRRYGGVGLGLALASNIAEAHGMILGVSSEVGKGSEFYFQLRLLRQDEDQ